MITRKIPSSGELIPAIGLGSWITFNVGDSENELAPMRNVLGAFVEAGGKVIDSSPMYGRSEKVIGKLAAELNVTDKLWFATKVWTTGESSGKTQIENYLLPLAAERGVGVIINKPFESGALFPAINNVSLPTWSKEWGISSWSAFFLKYIISNTNITCTIPATSQVSHLKENMAACFGPVPDEATRKKMVEYFLNNAR